MTLDGDEMLGIDDEPTRILRETYALAERVVAATWQHRRLPRADAAKIDGLLKGCSLGFAGGQPVIRGNAAIVSQYADYLEYEDPDRAPGDARPPERIPETVEQLTLGVQEGLITYVLEGRPRAVRACLWCGSFFRADRASALYDRAKCRVAFHRACGTAAGRDHSQVGQLKGLFRCDGCAQVRSLDDASGLVRSGDVVVGAATAPRAICTPCARERYPDWTDYFTPTTLVTP